MYSQNDEEKVILEFFGGLKGRLLDIGAYDAKDISNSMALIERGWDAVLIEPSPKKFLDLLRDFGQRHSVVLVNAAVHPQPGMRWFYFCKDADWGGTLEEAQVLRSRDHDFSIGFWVMPMPTAELAKWEPFDFINIDAEGLDFEIATSLPASFYQRCRMMCVEHGHKTNEEWITALNPYGFKLHHVTPENRMFIKP